MDTDSSKSTLDSLLGSTVKHFITNGSRVRIPSNENKFGSRAPVVGLEFKINQTVAALILWKIRTEIFVGLGSFSRFFNLDRLLVFDLVNVVPKLKSSSLKLEAVERGSNFVVDFYTGGLQKKNAENMTSEKNAN